MPLFLPQQALILMGCALVSGAFGYLYARRHERVMLDWSLSWAPDGNQFYIQTAQADAKLGWKLRHYVAGADGKRTILTRPELG